MHQQTRYFFFGEQCRNIDLVNGTLVCNCVAVMSHVSSRHTRWIRRWSSGVSLNVREKVPEWAAPRRQWAGPSVYYESKFCLQRKITEPALSRTPIDSLRLADARMKQCVRAITRTITLMLKEIIPWFRCYRICYLERLSVSSHLRLEIDRQAVPSGVTKGRAREPPIDRLIFFGKRLVDRTRDWTGLPIRTILLLDWLLPIAFRSEHHSLDETTSSTRRGWPERNGVGCPSGSQIDNENRREDLRRPSQAIPGISAETSSRTDRSTVVASDLTSKYAGTRACVHVTPRRSLDSAASRDVEIRCAGYTHLLFLVSLVVLARRSFFCTSTSVRRCFRAPSFFEWRVTTGSDSIMHSRSDNSNSSNGSGNISR